jgi:DNA-binding LacI/PurR family transcriptional regulator
MMALLRQRVDGILLVTTAGYNWSAENAAAIASGPPVVCVDRLPEGLNTDSVCVDDNGPAKLVVKHLLSLGHRRIASTGPLMLRNEQERLRGYRRALKDAELPVHSSLIWSASFEMEDIPAVCQRGLRRQKYNPTARFATNGVYGSVRAEELVLAGLHDSGQHRLRYI